MGYHKRIIEKGVFGEFSKIVEEFEEILDSHEQENYIMELIEFSDLMGAIEEYLNQKYKNSITIEDLIKMKNATKSAFLEGGRK